MSSDSSPEDKQWERTFALFKLEYEQATQRFENIYRAIWQIFQYMALLSAGILTFASKTSRFSFEVLSFSALSPLVFWFFAIYIPMDYYGQKARERLKHIESKINDKFGNYWQLYHYQSFYAEQQDSVCLWPPWNWRWRVKSAAFSFGLIILIFLIVFIWKPSWFYGHLTTKSSLEQIEMQIEPLEITIKNAQLQELKASLDALSKKMDSFELQIRQMKNHNIQQSVK